MDRVKMNKILLLIVFVIVAIPSSMAQKKEVQEIINHIEARFAPDKRTVIYDVKVSERKDTLVLKGETSSLEAHERILSEVKKHSLALKDSIRVLPDNVVGEKNYGVIYNSVEKVHARNGYGSEIVSEVLLGMPVRILDKKGGWRRIQTPEGYIGWISGAVETMTESQLRQYNQKPKIIITNLFTSSYTEPNTKTQRVSDLTIGNQLALKGTKGKFYIASYPDGREAFVPKTDAKKVEDWERSIVLSGESIVETAKQFAGIPYVWGGTSSKGLDCSGFTKTVYLLHGLILQRDASQQVNSGKLVDEKADFSKMQLGDLMFFGSKATEENPRERVVHVGIYIGNKRFIHASDYIQIGSFDPTDEFYDEYNANRYLRTKRIIGEVNTPGTEEIRKNTLYQ